MVEIQVLKLIDSSRRCYWGKDGADMVSEIGWWGVKEEKEEDLDERKDQAIKPSNLIYRLFHDL